MAAYMLLTFDFNLWSGIVVITTPYYPFIAEMAASNCLLISRAHQPNSKPINNFFSLILRTLKKHAQFNLNPSKAKMISIPQSSYFLSLNSTNTVSSSSSSSSKFRLSSTFSLEIKPSKTIRISSLPDSNAESVPSESPVAPSTEMSDGEAKVSDPVRLALEKAKAYKKSKQTAESVGVENKNEISVKVAMEKASKEFGKNTGVVGSDKNVGIQETKVEIPSDEIAEERLRNGGGSTISSISFLGLGFSDRRKNRVPAGLVPIVDPIIDGDMPDVELIVGDTSKFINAKPSQAVDVEDGSNLYKPKVSTWGVFPRPNDISKTFGGGRTIRPGEILETEEDKVVKETRTRQLLAAYKSKKGLTIDPKTKAECEKALKDGDNLMNLGKLREALPYYEKVVKALVFETELHGMAALQWAICQDSLGRASEARVKYEKLQSHPTFLVSKKARQFVFSFQAMEKLKVRSSSDRSKATDYQRYFEAFVEDKTNYTTVKDEEKEGSLVQVIPYILFLVSPIFLVLIVAVSKGLYVGM